MPAHPRDRAIVALLPFQLLAACDQCPQHLVAFLHLSGDASPIVEERAQGSSVADERRSAFTGRSG